MENTLQLPVLRFAFKKTINWFSVVKWQDGVRQINRFRLAQLTLFFVFLLMTPYNLLSGLNYSFATTGFGVVFCLFLQYLNDRGYEKTSRILFSLLLNLTAFLLCFAEGIASGAYFFYFLIVIIANFVLSKEDYLELKVVYAITFLMLAATFYFCPQKSFLQEIESESEQVNLFLNALISFIIGGMLSYHLMKDNFFKEKTLIKSQRYLDTVYNTSLDAVFIIDYTNGKIIDCNNQSIQLFNAKSKSSLQGKTLNDLIVLVSEESNEVFEKILHNPAISWKGELTCITENRKQFAGYVSIVPLNYDDRVLRKVNILDISDIKQAQSALLTAKDKAEQAVFARTRFVSNMSHELRTPLNGIIGTTNLLLQNDSLPDQRTYFDVLKYSSEHMLNLINEILDFSKIEAGKMDLEETTFDLNQLVDNIYKVFKGQFEEKNVGFEVNFDEQLSQRTYIGDPTRLTQVITNLVSNARKFTTSGSVTINIKQVVKTSSACTIKFVVADTGIGIPEEKRIHIFESFTQVESATTRKYGGTGLGLTISSKIVELYGGKLEVDSVEGEGSSFYFTIQLGVQNQPKKFLNEDKVKELPRLDGIRILLAEDNPINMMIAKSVLKNWGIELTEAVNGKIALDKYNEGEFDLLLIDLEMPEMDGFELLTEIRKTNSNIPGIAFTAALFENMLAHLVNKGFTDYVQKPFRPEDLHGKISQYVKKV